MNPHGTLIAGNPEYIGINPKYGVKYHVRNCAGVIMTTNYGSTGMYLKNRRKLSGTISAIDLNKGEILWQTVHGETDEFSYNIVRDPVHIRDFQATLLNQLGFDHQRLTYRFQGRDFRLTDVHGEVLKGIL